MLYSEKVMDHFKNPRNVGEIENADGIGEVGNVKCGDIMRMYIKVENDTIVDVKFMTFGCGSAIATSSMATELIPSQIFILILVIILAVVVIIVVSQWKKVSQSNNTLKLMEKEIELKKIAMVEKDLENKRLMEKKYLNRKA